MGHRPLPEPAAPRPDAGGLYTLSGEARNVRPFTEDTGWGDHRETIQVVSFTLDQFASGGLARSVYAEIRGRTIARRPVENEAVTVTGRFVGGRFEVRTLVGLRDDPYLPINDAAAPLRLRRGLLPFGRAALILLFGGALLFFGFVHNIAGPESHQPTPHVQSATGPGPWIIKGQGYIYEIVSASRTATTPDMGEPTASLTVRGFVTRTAQMDATSMSWELRNQDGVELKLEDPDPTTWEEAPTLDQRLPIALVVYDSKPEATTLTLAVSDFYRSDGGLILRNIPVR
jgi:hypothetical protein